MIKTINDENNAASYMTSSIRPLSIPDGPAQLLTALTVTAGNSSAISITSSTGSISAILTQGEVTPGSVWPLTGIDSFTELTNDTGSIAQGQDFNSLVSAILALETWTLRVARAAPGDLTERLNNAGGRTL